LLYFLAWRDILVRYKQTVIGIAWSVLRPLLTILIFTFIGSFFGADTHGAPRVLLVTAATLPWQFFASAFGEASNSMVANANLFTKVYFPRMIVPISTVIVCLIDFFISLVILIVFMLCYHFVPGLQIIFLPLFLILAIVTAMGAGIFVAALNVKYRDFRIIVPFIVQFGLYISPIAFSSADLYAKPYSPIFKFLYSLNPMVAVIDGFRWCILGDNLPIRTETFLPSVAISLVLLILGIWYFRKTEKTFADII
jgi:lipopolysaccharide transport system permease protein